MDISEDLLCSAFNYKVQTNEEKDNDLTVYLNKTIIKARHLACCFIFTLQNYYLLPMTIRKQITNVTIFKSKNKKEWETISCELLNMNKEDTLKLYNYVFDEPYNHLDIETLTNKLYKNFNLLEISE